MRLIDADALKVKCGEWYTEEGTEEGFIGTLGSLLDTAPTVPAIPVEWLQRRRDIYLKAYRAGHESEIHTAAILNDTLMAWQKEQEAK